MRVLESINRALREAPDERNRVLTAAELLALTPFTPDQADALLLAAWENGLRRARQIKPKLRADLGQTLTALRRYLGVYSWTAGDGHETALSGHRLLLLPPGTHGVVFDATARLNNVYLGRLEEFRVLDTTPVRDYSTVTVHEARTTETGKRAARNAGPKLAAETIAALRAHYGGQASTRRVLVVTAKVVETHFRKAGRAAGFAAFDVAHWGRIDGRNDWRDYDTLCIATLPYATNSLDLNIFMAVREAALDDDALNAPPDEVMLVRENRMAAQFAQAIGRIRLRTMTKGDGTCEPCDIFLRLPNSRRQVDSDRILDAITRTLPGAAVVRWERASRKLGHRPPSTRDAAVARLLALPAGSAVTAKAIGATHGTWQRILEAAATAGHPLSNTLAERGLRLVRGGNLRGDSGRALPWLAPIPEV